MKFFSFLLIFSCFLGFTNAQNVRYSPILGAASDTSVRILFFTHSADEVTLQISTDSNYAMAKNYPQIPDAALHNRVLTDVTGLQPATHYYYRILINGQPDSLHGYFTTFPPAGTRQHYVIGTGSCQETPNMKIFNVIDSAKPDIFIHTGDWTYPDYMVKDYPKTEETVFRGYEMRYTEKEMEDMLPHTLMDYIGDNHDGIGGSSHSVVKRATYRYEGKKVVNFFEKDTILSEVRQRVVKGYVDYFPSYPLQDTTIGLYHSFTMGNAEFFVLDIRMDADFPPDAFSYDSIKNHWTFEPDSNHKMIGDKQMDWLKQGLKNSKADWKFIVTSIPFNKNLRHLIDLGIHFQDMVISAGGERGTGFRLACSWSFYWAGFPASIDELLGFIKENNLKDIMVLSGDTHHNVIDDGRNAGLPELNASGLSVTGTVLAHYMNLVGRVAGYPKIKKYLWNGGGNGIGNKNYKNAYGRIDIYGADSVKMSIVDEDNEEISAVHLPHSSTLKATKVKKERKPHYIKRVERISYRKRPTFRIRFLKAMGRVFMKGDKSKM